MEEAREKEAAADKKGGDKPEKTVVADGPDAVKDRYSAAVKLGIKALKHYTIDDDSMAPTTNAVVGLCFFVSIFIARIPRTLLPIRTARPTARPR